MKILLPVGIFAIVTGFYVLSYQYSQRSQTEEETENISSSDNRILAGESQNTVPGNEISENVAAGDNQTIYVTPRMTYTLEVYDTRNDQRTSQTETIPMALYGLSREETAAYLSNLGSIESAGSEDCTIHYDLLLFSADALTVRRTLTEKEEEYALFLIAEDGYLVAYTGDLTAIFEHTQIPLGDFPLEQQAMLTSGIYMKTMADYYDFLETYSS